METSSSRGTHRPSRYTSKDSRIHRTSRSRSRGQTSLRLMGAAAGFVTGACLVYVVVVLWVCNLSSYQNSAVLSSIITFALSKQKTVTTICGGIGTYALYFLWGILIPPVITGIFGIFIGWEAAASANSVAEAIQRAMEGVLQKAKYVLGEMSECNAVALQDRGTK
ncbi:hypothetical protein DNTS_004493 [Danionella cerebrum]|uniref:Uncharacterized protein n=1 Tax=Danionella cerebrum TaxID=2873325 RepID=A0A553REF2_9TELE|nr:hypothetical protein DNTS_004493 [Danionella translucida]